MSTLEAVLLGIIQGITEFFPVSSSGHLALIERLLGRNDFDSNLIFHITLHQGTLLSIFVVYWQEIYTMLTRQRTRFWQICLACLPLFPLVIIMKPIKNVMADPNCLGFGFLATSLFLFLGEWAGNRQSALIEPKRFSTPLAIGAIQAIALFPGVSRSGSTISTARLFGWSRDEAICFSFFLAIPTVVGAALYEIAKEIYKGNNLFMNSEIPWSHYLIGFLVSFAVGTLSLLFIKRLAGTGSFRGFAWYCLLVGLATFFVMA